MTSPRHFLLLVSVNIVLAFPSGKDIKDCAVNYYQKENIRATRLEIASWVPTKRDDSAFNLTITFEGKEEEIWYDKIELFRNKYRFTRWTGIHNKSQNESKLAWEVMEGWGTFRLEVDNKYKLFYETLNGSKLLLEEAYDNTLRSLRIEGSNVTLDCLEKFRTWEVAAELAVIPLDKSKQHRLTLVSTKDIYPSIKLGSKEYPLRWINQTISSIEGKGPLPKFISHNITISCESEGHGVVCLIKDEAHGKLLERVTLSEFPDHLSVKKDEGYAFTAILHLQNFSSAMKHLSGEGGASRRDDETYNQFIWKISIIFTIVLPALVISVYLCSKKLKQRSMCHQRRKCTKTEEQSHSDVSETQDDSDVEKQALSQRHETSDG